MVISLPERLPVLVPSRSGGLPMIQSLSLVTKLMWSRNILWQSYRTLGSFTVWEEGRIKTIAKLLAGPRRRFRFGDNKSLWVVPQSAQKSRVNSMLRVFLLHEGGNAPFLATSASSARLPQCVRISHVERRVSKEIMAWVNSPK